MNASLGGWSFCHRSSFKIERRGEECRECCRRSGDAHDRRPFKTMMATSLQVNSSLDVREKETKVLWNDNFTIYMILTVKSILVLEHPLHFYKQLLKQMHCIGLTNKILSYKLNWIFLGFFDFGNCFNSSFSNFSVIFLLIPLPPIGLFVIFWYSATLS